MVLSHPFTLKPALESASTTTAPSRQPLARVLKNVTDPCHRRSVRHDLSRPGFDGGGDAPSGTTDLGVVGQAMLR